ncbi:MAG: magnesium-translocating P-type ATPase, partial [Proteobacteria bacterium]|nr:magnesium-translocating P-type ATPase [Pseudomonadota bacterium]
MPGAACWTARSLITPADRPRWHWPVLLRPVSPGLGSTGLTAGAPAADIVLDARLPEQDLLRRLDTGRDGLTETEAAARLQRVGPNQVMREAEQSAWLELAARAKNPLNALLLGLALISWLTGDARAALVICFIVALSVLLSFVQEHRSSRAAASLRAMVKTRVAVHRRAEGGGSQVVDIAIDRLVPGDIVSLAAGDIVPADLRLLEARILHVNQAALTGEALPVDKSSAPPDGSPVEPFEAANLCFMGSHVVSGSGVAVVLRTGQATAFGQLAESLTGPAPSTSFDRGVARFTWLMIRFMAVLVPAVFLINGLTKGDWLEALLFAVAVAVGLTPEMLPMIVTVNLAKGALAMARKRVIVKRLPAIQNFGAMDVLCTDKTGTLTQDRVILQYHLDFEGEESDRVLEFAYLNSYHQSGLRNLLDEAVLAHANRPEHTGHIASYQKADEIPFDFQRRRMSVVLRRPDGVHLMITKGAVEEVLGICNRYVLGDSGGTLDPRHLVDAKREMAKLNADGFRVVAVAFKAFTDPPPVYDESAEQGLTLLGYVAFLDPPKESVDEALRRLARAGVGVRVLTGDNDVITRTICRQVGLSVDRIVLGHELDAMDDAALSQAVEEVPVFAKMTP